MARRRVERRTLPAGGLRHVDVELLGAGETETSAESVCFVRIPFA